MRRLRRRHVLIAAGAGALPAAAGTRQVWRDPRRGRDIPVLLRWPDGPGPAPLLLLSHGLGGSRDGMGYLGRAVAAAGFAALHLQHPGTDADVWRGVEDRRFALGAALLDVGNAVDRLHDVAFAIDEATRRPDIAARVDPRRIAAAGHSYGAWTVQHMLGQRLPGARADLPVLPDPRLRAGIALSPTGALGLPPRLAFARMAAPILYVTGTRDFGYIEGAEPEDRETPFRASSAPAALAVLDGAWHGSFADEPAAGGRWADATHHPRVSALAVAFLRAVLLDDPAARASLHASAPLGPADRLEIRAL